MRLVFLTKYTPFGASSRYRSYLYFKYLKDYFGYNIYYNSFFNDKYLIRLYGNKGNSLFSLFYFLVKRIYFILFKIKKNDIIFIEYEIIPFFPPIFELYLKKRRIKYVLDFDDAIFHNYDSHKNIFVKYFFQNKISEISKYASAIITGNSYLSNYFKNYNQNIFEIPTSVPFEDYSEIINFKSENTNIYIGWIGSKTTSVNLLPFSKLFNEITQLRSNIYFIFCGFDDKYKHLFNEKIIFLDWNSQNEKYFLSKINIGIMPLLDNNFNKGKCGFKLVQYMASGIPTISTPLQSNIDIDNGNGNLFASSIEEWNTSIRKMIDNYQYFKTIGQKNIDTIKNRYSLESNVFHIDKIIKSIS